MSTPTIPAGNLYMNATLWTGDNGTQAVTNGVAGQSFQPDFVWLKNRTTAYSHLLYDSVRGAGTLKAIGSANTNAEGAMNDNSTYGYLSALNSNGFTVVSGSTANSYTNSSSNNYVGWQWKAGGTAVTNTSGTISSQVSANTTSGFSIVTYTGTGSAATVGHGLGVIPSMIIVKERSTTRDWPVWHTTLTGGQVLFLNSTAATSTDTAVWNNTTPTSSVFSVSTSTYTNQSSGTYVAYCWTPIAGYSAFGSYTGNGSSDGPFVYLGFRPKCVIFKRTDSAGADWVIVDTTRDPYNGVQNQLFPDLSNAESSGTIRWDFLSNGFKLRTTFDPNSSGGTYIYAAFAENPFKYANAR